MDIVYSVNQVPIRLTDERWVHIVESHDDMAGFKDDVLNCLETPDFIVQGYKNALIALKRKTGKKYLAVVYKESNKTDGFIITSYFSSKINFSKLKILWKQ